MYIYFLNFFKLVIFSVHKYNEKNVMGPVHNLY